MSQTLNPNRLRIKAWQSLQKRVHAYLSSAHGAINNTTGRHYLKIDLQLVLILCMLLTVNVYSTFSLQLFAINNVNSVVDFLVISDIFIILGSMVVIYCLFNQHRKGWFMLCSLFNYDWLSSIEYFKRFSEWGELLSPWTSNTQIISSITMFISLLAPLLASSFLFKKEVLKHFGIARIQAIWMLGISILAPVLALLLLY